MGSNTKGTEIALDTFFPYQRKLIQFILHYSPLQYMIFRKEGKCLYWNMECRKNLGWTSQQAKKNKNILSYLFPEQSYREKIWQAAIKHPGRFFRVAVRTQRGEIRNQLWSNFLLRPDIMLSIGNDISKEIKTRKLLRQWQKKLRNLYIHLDQLIEDEKSRISRDIHDELGQMLSLLRLDLDWLRSRCQLEQEQEREKIDIMSKRIESMLEWVRKITQELRPGILDQLGIGSAIEWMLNRFTEQTKITYTFHSDPGSVVLEKAVETKLFRVVQEALTNIMRHSWASHVDIHLCQRKNKIQLTIEDDGIGIPREKITDPDSLGLIGMAERVRSLHGTFKIKGYSGKGTIITVSFPYKSGGAT